MYFQVINFTSINFFQGMHVLMYVKQFKTLEFIEKNRPEFKSEFAAQQLYAFEQVI